MRMVFQVVELKFRPSFWLGVWVPPVELGDAGRDGAGRRGG